VVLGVGSLAVAHIELVLDHGIATRLIPRSDELKGTVPGFQQGSVELFVIQLGAGGQQVSAFELVAADFSCMTRRGISGSDFATPDEFFVEKLDKVAVECLVLPVAEVSNGVNWVLSLVHFDVPDVVHGAEVRGGREADLSGGAAPIQNPDLIRRIRRRLVVDKGVHVGVDGHPPVHTLIHTVQDLKFGLLEVVLGTEVLQRHSQVGHQLVGQNGFAPQGSAHTRSGAHVEAAARFAGDGADASLIHGSGQAFAVTDVGPNCEGLVEESSHAPQVFEFAVKHLSHFGQCAHGPLVHRHRAVRRSCVYDDAGRHWQWLVQCLFRGQLSVGGQVVVHRYA